MLRAASPPVINPYPGYYNLDPSMLPHWRSVVAKVRAGTGRGRVAILGDSTTAGAGAGSAGVISLNYNGARPNTWPSALKTLLNSFVATNNGVIYGDQGTAIGANYPTYDTRVTFGAGWSAGAASTAGLGGNLFHYATGSATALAFTPVAAFDNILIYYVRNGTSGSFTTDIDGGASLGTTSAVGGVAFLTQAYTVAKGTHTIHLNAQNDNPLFIGGILTWDSTTPAIDIIQLGQSGAKVADFTGTGNVWLGLNALGTIAPDLTIIDLTINDSNAPTDLATYTASMQSLITKAKLSGDVILMVGPPSSTTQATDGTLDSFVAALTGLAATNNCPLVNLKQIWTSYAVKNAITPYFDTLHPTAVGYQDIAQAVLRTLIL